jgi:hypothetical protein
VCSSTSRSFSRLSRNACARYPRPRSWNASKRTISSSSRCGSLCSARWGPPVRHHLWRQQPLRRDILKLQFLHGRQPPVRHYGYERGKKNNLSLCLSISLSLRKSVEGDGAAVLAKQRKRAGLADWNEARAR